MKKSMRMLALVLSFIMVLGMFPMVHAEEAPVLANADDIVVYYTNDVHTYIDGELSYDNIADLKTATEAQAAGVLLVDAGDHIQGTAYGSMDKGKTIIDLMNASGYDLATLGNHEFDYGMDGRIKVTDEWAEFPYVSSNFYHEENGVVGETVLDSYKVFEMGGKKIAFIGITTPESFTKSTPAYFQDENGNYIYGIAGGEDGQELYKAVQRAIDNARMGADADIVIALGHLGDDPASRPWTSEELIRNTWGLDAFIDGHSHSTVEMKKVYDKNGDPVVLTQTGQYFAAVGKMTISKKGEITTELVTEWAGSDASVKAIKDEWLTEIDTQLGEVIGYTDIVFDNYDESGRLVRKMETNTGNFAADALYYLFDNMGLDVDVAVMNGGGVRNKSVTGEISYLTCKTIHTFGNVACLQTVTGQQILDALEWGARGTPIEDIGGFLHVSGLTYEIDTTVASTVQMDDKGVWVGGPTGEYRVRNVKILQDGEYVDLDLTAEYNLAGYNYTLRDLGDGFAMFDGAVNVLDYVMEDYMVLANYVKSFPVNENGLHEIPADDERYASVYGEGRISLILPSDDVVVYYTNDVHTYIDGTISYDNIAWLKQNTNAADVLLVDAGDHIQGTAYGSMDKGKTIIDLMNAAGYDLATFGNHEFDYGMSGAMNTLGWADFPYVSSNFYHEFGGIPGETVVDAYKIFTASNGLKIAFVGITTPETFTKSTPAYFQDDEGNYIYGIAGGVDGSELYAAVQAAIDAASAEADIVIALGHLGDDPASQPWTSEELIANTTGLAAFIDGHSHSTVPGKQVADKDGNTVLLTQTGQYFEAIGKMTITAEGEISTELVTEVAGSDAAVKAIKDAWMTEIDTQLGEVIGYTDIVFDNYDSTGRLVRKQETNTGNFAADALYYLFDNMGLDVDVAIMNGGGVRNKTVTGELSYQTMKTIHTFGNVACLQTITGQQLLDALEWGARDAGNAECGGFLQVSGITYTIDTTIASTVQKDDKGVWTGGPTGEYRVKNVKIMQNGEWVDLDLTASYNLAGYNYTLRDLGDGFAMFDGAVNVLDYVMEDYMVLANYVKSFPVNENGLHEIPADDVRYASVYGEGRIKILKDFDDVPAGSFYYEAVKWAVENGITNGATATTFNPNGSLMRAQVVTMLWRAAGEPVPATTVNPFNDVKESDFFYTAVLWAVEEGITSGMSANEFKPYASTNRAQAVTFLWRFLGKPAATGTNSFTDVKAGEWYEAAINWAVENGVTNGQSEGVFGIHNKCNRAHMVTFLYRASKIEQAPEEAPETPVQKFPILLKGHGGTVVCSVDEAAPGEIVTFTAVPDTGKVFTQFKIFDPNHQIDTSKFQLFEGSSENEYAFVMIAHELIVDCIFQ